MQRTVLLYYISIKFFLQKAWSFKTMLGENMQGFLNCVRKSIWKTIKSLTRQAATSCRQNADVHWKMKLRINAFVCLQRLIISFLLAIFICNNTQYSRFFLSYLLPTTFLYPSLLPQSMGCPLPTSIINSRLLGASSLVTTQWFRLMLIPARWGSRLSVNKRT